MFDWLFGKKKVITAPAANLVEVAANHIAQGIKPHPHYPHPYVPQVHSPFHTRQAPTVGAPRVTVVNTEEDDSASLLTTIAMAEVASSFADSTPSPSVDKVDTPSFDGFGGGDSGGAGASGDY